MISFEAVRKLAVVEFITRGPKNIFRTKTGRKKNKSWKFRHSEEEKVH